MKANDQTLYIVAKDLCLLLNVRKNNVSKFIRHLSQRNRPKMLVQCYRTDGKIPVQSLTVLTLSGAKALLLSAEQTRRTSDIQSVSKWLADEIPELKLLE